MPTLDQAKKIALFVTALLLVAIGLWRTSGNDATSEVENGADTESDSFVTQAHFIEFNHNGRPEFDLKSKEAKQFSQYDRIIFTDPELVMRDEKGTPWRLTAESGRYNTATQTMELRHAVKVSGGAQTANALSMTTRSLTVNKPAKYLTSEDRVTFTTANAQLEGVGMQAWIDEKRILLNASVEGIYQPPTRPNNIDLSVDSP